MVRPAERLGGEFRADKELYSGICLSDPIILLNPKRFLLRCLQSEIYRGMVAWVSRMAH